jgi:vacuolar-type H+-ATPase subunit E/Vma4
MPSSDVPDVPDSADKEPPGAAEPSEWEALAPLRSALLAGARAEAARIRDAASTEAQRILDQAHREAAELLATARAQGEADAATVLAAEAADAQRVARQAVLSAQRDVYERLRGEALEAVRRLLADPATRAALAARIRDRLGEDATVRADPDGGLRGESGDGRSIDASATALVDRALAGVDGDRLWAGP